VFASFAAFFLSFNLAFATPYRLQNTGLASLSIRPIEACF